MKAIVFLLVIAMSFSAQAANDLKFKRVIELSESKGQTYLSLMETQIKPALDEIAIEGFYVLSANQVIASLKKVDSKVSWKVKRALGSGVELADLIEELTTVKRKVNFYQLPDQLGQLGVGRGRYDLTTFLSLVSGGGVAINIDENNTAYNVNYGTGKQVNDEKTGRSFGESKGRLALDASDAHYLKILEDYVRQEPENTENFYLSILQILLNSDSSHFGQMSEQGQIVATDFIAVYTAEQDRHLMSNMKKHPWEVALLEVTLLSSLHSGQDKIMMIFNGEFTDTTVKQKDGCDVSPDVEKLASLVDYWQFSRSQDPANCKRSGLNITKSDFRKLGAGITAFEKKYRPELVAKVQRHFPQGELGKNLFEQLTSYIVNGKTPKKLGAQANQLAKDFTEFLMQVQADAPAITKFIAEAK